MTTAPRVHRLFTLRLWQERISTELAEWRGQVQALPEGDASYFRDWPGLIRQLEVMLAAGDSEQQNSEP